MEEKFHRKAKEIGLIQIELKMIKEFRKKKTLLEKELEDVSLFLTILILIFRRASPLLLLSPFIDSSYDRKI